MKRGYVKAKFVIEILAIKNQLGKSPPQSKLKFPQKQLQTIELLKSGKISVRSSWKQEN